MKKAIQAVLSHHWAITEDALDTIASIAERESEYHHNLTALEAKLGRPLGNTMSASVRDGVAIIPVEGPLFAKANLMTEFSGATSYDVLARDFTQAIESEGVRAVMLSISSPGGEVEGASELAQLIRTKANETGKKVYAYIGGTGASAAYWIASAADKIVAADTAIVGSIGVMAGYTVKDPKPGEKSYKFISSQSPYKNASPENDAGASRIQANIDALAQVFIETVARNRNKKGEEAVQWTGQGAVFVASEAMSLGMIDAIGTFESTLETLTMSEIQKMDYKTLTVATLTENRADLVAEITAAAVAGVEKVDVAAVQAQAAADERARIVALEALAMPGTEDLIAKFKGDGTKPEAAAIQILQAAKAGAGKPAAAAAGHLAALKATEDALTPPQAGTGTDTEITDEQAATAALKLARQAGVDA